MVNPNSQNKKSKFNLLVCEIHNTWIHGKTKDSAKDIDGHYLVYEKFDGITGLPIYNRNNEYDSDMDTDTDTDTDSEIDRNINIYCKVWNEEYAYLIQSSDGGFSSHPLIRNYYNIVSRNDYIKPEIGQCIILPTQESVAILKTFWLRIIQRAWKKVYKNRQLILMARRVPFNLSIREVKGEWPLSIRYLPGLKGLLYGL